MGFIVIGDVYSDMVIKFNEKEYFPWFNGMYYL